jgi:hypothetical protein
VSILRVQIRQPSGQVDPLLIESERVLIGSGAHCEIRLPLDQAAVEHVQILVRGAGVFVQVLSFQPPPTINTVPFTQGPLPPDAVLGIGQFQLTVALTNENFGGGAVVQKKKKSQGASPLSLIALLMIGAGAYFLFFNDEQSAAQTMPREAPELFGPPLEACPQKGATQALALARERQTVADAKRERRPFHVQDGIAAVPVYELAAACYRQAGAQAEAADAASAAAALRREVNDDYRTHRVRLEHSLATKDLESARREVRLLLLFTEGKQGDYVSWLSNLDRTLKLKLGRPTT